MRKCSSRVCSIAGKRLLPRLRVMGPLPALLFPFLLLAPAQLC